VSGTAISAPARIVGLAPRALRKGTGLRIFLEWIPALEAKIASNRLGWGLEVRGIVAKLTYGIGVDLMSELQMFADAQIATNECNYKIVNTSIT
jgi:hypothetical protein